MPSYTCNHCGCLQRDAHGPRVLGTLWRVQAAGLRSFSRPGQEEILLSVKPGGGGLSPTSRVFFLILILINISGSYPYSGWCHTCYLCISLCCCLKFGCTCCMANLSFCGYHWNNKKGTSGSEYSKSDWTSIVISVCLTGGCQRPLMKAE